MMIKLRGSKRAKIVCIECGEVSSPFRAYLYNEYEYKEDKNPEEYWESSKTPKDWGLPDYEEAELYDDGTVYGYCPTHREEWK